MGRTKGQIEEFDFGGLSDEDLYSLLSHSDESIRASHLELRSLNRQINEQSDGSSEDSFTAEEVGDVLESIHEYEPNISNIIEERIEVAGETVEVIKEEIATKIKEKSQPSAPPKHQVIGALNARKAKAQEEVDLWKTLKSDFESLFDFQEPGGEKATEKEDRVDRRRTYLTTYLELKSELGRVPFRGELEETHLKSSSEAKGRRSVSMAATRLGLRLGDARIHKQIEKLLKRRQSEPSERLSKAEHLDILEQAFSHLKIKTPEAKRLRRCLDDARFERLLEIVNNKKIFQSIESEVLSTTTYSNESESSPRFPYPSEAKVDCSVNGSERAYDLLVGLKTFSKLWSRTHLWAFDFSWVHPGRRPDYEQAADSFFLTALRHALPEREAGAWLKRIAEMPHCCDLVLRYWPPLSLLEGLPFAPSGREGAQLLMDIFEKIEAPRPSEQSLDFPLCQHLADADGDFRILLDFLNPYDVLLKGEEYGFPFPPG